MATATLRKRTAKPHLNGRTVDKPSTAFSMPAGSMTLDEFRQWTYSDRFPKTGLIAYIGQEIFIDISPERLTSHGLVKTEVCTVVNGIVRKKKSGRFYFDRTRFSNENADVSNEPDGLYVTFKSFKSGKVREIPTSEGDDFIELEGTPDWILEIVSPSSVGKDKKTLRSRYHRAGVSEYWIIDARGKNLDFQILAHDEDDYKSAQREGEWQVSKTFGKKFRLRRTTDELGGTEYRLDVK